LQNLINVLTTNKTAFFREKHHFEHLATQALPSLLEDCSARGTRRLRIWSAGCSSGEEAYTIAMTLHDSVPNLANWDARILATDIDTEVIEQGRRGVYDTGDTKVIPPMTRRKFLEPMAGDKTQMRMVDDLRPLINYRPLNLLGAWPMTGCFDVIFCRNVVIYFDKPTQRVLFDRFADILRDNCFLYIGHAESLYKVTERFRVVGKGVYRKIS
jgi:chemotaxis protein methyltransferase CheR